MAVIKRFIKRLMKLCKILGVVLQLLLIKVTRNKNAFILMATPNHANLGDHAIVLGEIKLFREIDKKPKIIEIDTDVIGGILNTIKKLIGTRTIYIHGGGFMGTLWMEQEEMLRRVITRFKDNHIIIMPQTVYYENSQFGYSEMQKTQEIFRKHKNLLICLREQVSYELSKEIFSTNQCILMPDMVTYLDNMSIKNVMREGIMFCLRSDKEKKLDDALVKEIKNYFSKSGNIFYGDSINYQDTVIDHMFTRRKRVMKIQEIISLFSKQHIIITDRLHGMVLAAIAGTPCIVFGNCNHKVYGVYQWINNNSYITYIDNPDIQTVCEALQQKSLQMNYVYDNKKVKTYFDTLKKIINDDKLTEK